MGGDDPNQLLVVLWGVTISAKGIVAICVLAVPLALLLGAVALRIAGRKM